MLMEEVELLRAACCIAGLDGRVSEPELRIIEKLADRVGVGSMSLKTMLELGRTDPDFYEQQLHMVQHDPVRTMRTLLRVAAADGAVTTNERVILNYFTEKIGLGRERFDAIVDELKKKARQRPQR